MVSKLFSAGWEAQGPMPEKVLPFHAGSEDISEQHLAGAGRGLQGEQERWDPAQGVPRKEVPLKWIPEW